MAALYSNTNDGDVASDRLASWAAARDDTDGATVTTNNQGYTSFTSASRFGSRGGGNTYEVRRSFMYFDTSSITTAVSSVTIKIRGYNDAKTSSY